MADRRGLRIAAVTAALGVGVLGVALWLRGRTPALAPDFAVPDLAGQAVRLSAYRGRVVLVNLWATWCPPCREEIPSLQKLYDRLKDRGFMLLAVSQDETGLDTLRPCVEQMKMTFPVLVDPERDVGRKFGVWGYPESFLVDREGRIVERVIGPRDWASATEIAQIEALLSAATQAADGSHGG
jgi:peroxiredoxin